MIDFYAIKFLAQNVAYFIQYIKYAYNLTRIILICLNQHSKFLLHFALEYLQTNKFRCSLLRFYHLFVCVTTERTTPKLQKN